MALSGMPTSATAADLVVSDQQLSNVTAMTYGVNTPNYINNKFVESTGPAMMLATGATHIRWPGGNYANMLFWNNDYSSCPYFSQYKAKNNPSWMWTWQQAGAFAQKQSLEVLWQMNAAVGFICGPAAAAALAASFVATATKAGVDVKYIEVGNENYGKWEVPYKDAKKAASVSPTAYAAVCSAVVKAVKAVKASIVVGCVGDLITPGASNTPFLDWNAKVLAGAGTDMDFLIIHEYYTKVSAGSDTSAWNMLNYGCASSAGPNCGPASVAAAVKADVAKYAPTRKSALPIMITEYNMEQPYQAETWSLVEGLFAAKHLGDSMQAGLMGTTFFALANGKSPDFGMFSKDATQVAYAPVYAFAIFSRVAPVGSSLLSSTMDTQSLNVTSYAFSRPEANEYGIVLINMGAAPKTISLSGPWGESNLSAYIYTLTGSTGDPYTATRFAYNGKSGAAKGGPYPFNDIAPLKEAFTGSVTLGASSVTGLVIAPSAAPGPSPPTPPTPAPGPAPPAAGKCCLNGGCVKCHSPGWCTASRANCEKHCSGKWCTPEADLLV